MCHIEISDVLLNGDYTSTTLQQATYRYLQNVATLNCFVPPDGDLRLSLPALSDASCALKMSSGTLGRKQSSIVPIPLYALGGGTGNLTGTREISSCTWGGL